MTRMLLSVAGVPGASGAVRCRAEAALGAAYDRRMSGARLQRRRGFSPGYVRSLGSPPALLTEYRPAAGPTLAPGDSKLVSPVHLPRRGGRCLSRLVHSPGFRRFDPFSLASRIRRTGRASNWLAGAGTGGWDWVGGNHLVPRAAVATAPRSLPRVTATSAV